MRSRSTVFVWVIGLIIGIAAGALAAMLLLPDIGSNASGTTLISGQAGVEQPLRSL